MVSMPNDLTAAPPSDNATGVLGCTGAVGQRLMLLLMEQPHFDLHAIGASHVATWKQTEALPVKYGGLVVESCWPEEIKDCDIVFSGLGSSVGGNIEMAFLKANLAVFSNGKGYRQDALVPLVVGTVNFGSR